MFSENEKWHLEQKNSVDIRTVTFIITTDLLDMPEKIVNISLSGSLMTQLRDSVEAQYESNEYVLQLAILAATLLKKELEINPESINNSDLKFGYVTDNFPFGALEIPKIEKLESWKFIV